MTELDILKNRLAELKRREPTLQTEIGVGCRWMLEMSYVMVAISDYNVRALDGLQSK